MKYSNYSTTSTSFGFHLSFLQISIVFYFGFIFGISGLILNIIGIVVFNRKMFSKKAIGFYNIIIAIVNSCVIIISSISYMPLYFYQNPLLWSSTSCMILNFSQHTFTVLSSLLDMMITFDRMIRISFPRKFDAIKKQKGIIFISLGFLLLSIGLNSFCFKYKIQETFLTDTSLYNQTNATVTLSCIADYSILLSKNIITIIFRIFLPFTVMIVSDIILIYKLKKEKGERYSKKEKAFSHSVLALSILFLITHLPFAILLIYQTVLEFRDTNYKTNFTISLLYELSIIFTAYNYVFPTLVNLTFNKLFREEFIILLGLKKQGIVSSTTEQHC
jgi:hypothetical protein